MYVEVVTLDGVPADWMSHLANKTAVLHQTLRQNEGIRQYLVCVESTQSATNSHRMVSVPRMCRIYG
jgi:hypothetical protein